MLPFLERPDYVKFSTLQDEIFIPIPLPYFRAGRAPNVPNDFQNARALAKPRRFP